MDNLHGIVNYYFRPNTMVAQSVEAVEYTDYFTAEG